MLKNHLLGCLFWSQLPQIIKLHCSKEIETWEQRAKYIAAPNYEYIKCSYKSARPVTANSAQYSYEHLEIGKKHKQSTCTIDYHLIMQKVKFSA